MIRAMAGGKHQKSRALITVVGLGRNLVPEEKKEGRMQQHCVLIKSCIILLF